MNFDLVGSLLAVSLEREAVRVVRRNRWMARRRDWMRGMMRLLRKRRVQVFRAFTFFLPYYYYPCAFINSSGCFLAFRSEQNRCR
jgi:hypothetical protein